MGRIRFEPGPATLLGQAIVAEIEAAGHRVTDGAAGMQITGAVLQFEAHAEPSLLYWDVIGNVAVSLHIAPAGRANPLAPLVYKTRCLDRTYVWPGETVIAGVMGKCISELATQLRHDSRAAAALRGH